MKQSDKPYKIVFVGVNGTGKTTSLAKIAYLLNSHNFKVLIAACDTYRSGAVDQLEQHSKSMSIELFSKGGNRREPTPVAREAIKYAKERDYDVLLIDTAGRMQDNLNLMTQIAHLVHDSKPDLTLFVADATVGTNGSDQIQKFDKAIQGYGGQNARGIDGILLTKFDIIDDKVGASITLVYETGHPIFFVGVGQFYPDLRTMNPTAVVEMLLDGI
jgi:signal recognition particle receptor subunit alpha